MADRRVKAPGDPENTREVVELDNEDRWQARLEEARARREIALREKASQPKKPRLKPWETEPGADDEDDAFEIQPVIQEKPADEPDLDFADRLEVMRETSKMADRAVSESAAPKPTPNIAPEPPADPPAEPTPIVRSVAASAPPDLTPVPIVPPPAPKPKPRRETPIVAPDAPDVIDLAHRYASTLKPPVNVTEDVERVYSQPAPVPIIEPQPSRYSRPTTAPSSIPLEPMAPVAGNRRPFGIGVAVLAFSLLPLAQTAPPLEKGPAVPPTPFFGLPPALGLTTSMVWRPETTASNDWQPSTRIAPFPGFAAYELVPQGSVNAAAGVVSALPRLQDQETSTTLNWSQLSTTTRVPAPDSLDALSNFILPQSLPPMQSPRPQPKATPEAPAIVPSAPDALNVPLTTRVPVAPTGTLDANVPTATPEARPDASGTSVSPVLPDVSVTPPTPTPSAPEASRAGDDTVVDAQNRPPVKDTLAAAVPQIRPNTDPGRPVSTPENPLKVTILVPAAANRDDAERIAQDTERRGHELTRIKEVNLTISQPNVRYFHDRDRAEAARLADAYSADVKDFTWFRPKPEPGTTEIWLSGRPQKAAVRPPRVQAAPEPVEAPPRTITVIRRQPTLLERLFTGSDGEIEIILPDPNGILSDNGVGDVNEN